MKNPDDYRCAEIIGNRYGSAHTLEYLLDHVGYATGREMILKALDEMDQLGTSIVRFPWVGIAIFKKGAI